MTEPTIQTWDDFDKHIGSDKPLPLLGIGRPLVKASMHSMSASSNPHLMDTLAGLARSLRGPSAQPSLLQSLAMETPQTIGSLSASTGLEVEDVSKSVEGLVAEGWIAIITESGVEKVDLQS